VITIYDGDSVYSRSKEVVVDTKAEVKNLSLSPEVFSPNGDGYEDSVLIGLRVVRGW
jgi:hypothetical protein